ncbi:MAG: hypothetical protein JNK78_03170 [Planctomycetes bacterium]|nr:hypothetical protein [Planctomycetota bacterium]
MASRFELVADGTGKIHFVLRGQDGTALLESRACESKIMAQNAVLHARTALKTDANLTEQSSSDGKHALVLADKDGSTLARSAAHSSPSALGTIRSSILAVAAAAPIVDLTKRSAASASR